jgi:hypothetical protein
LKNFCWSFCLNIFYMEEPLIYFYISRGTRYCEKFIGHKIFISGTFISTPPKRFINSMKRTQLRQQNSLKYEKTNIKQRGTKRQVIARGGYANIANCRTKIPAKIRGIFGCFAIFLEMLFIYSMISRRTLVGKRFPRSSIFSINNVTFTGIDFI